jgi:hypothetical protein
LRLRNEAVPDLGVEPDGQHGRQQDGGVAVGEALDDELR